MSTSRVSSSFAHRSFQIPLSDESSTEIKEIYFRKKQKNAIPQKLTNHKIQKNAISRISDKGYNMKMEIANLKDEIFFLNEVFDSKIQGLSYIELAAALYPIKSFNRGYNHDNKVEESQVLSQYIDELSMIYNTDSVNRLYKFNKKQKKIIKEIYKDVDQKNKEIEQIKNQINLIRKTDPFPEIENQIKTIKDMHKKMHVVVNEHRILKAQLREIENYSERDLIELNNQLILQNEKLKLKTKKLKKLKLQQKQKEESLKQELEQIKAKKKEEIERQERERLLQERKKKFVISPLLQNINLDDSYLKNNTDKKNAIKQNNNKDNNNDKRKTNKSKSDVKKKISSKTQDNSKNKMQKTKEKTKEVSNKDEKDMHNISDAKQVIEKAEDNSQSISDKNQVLTKENHEDSNNEFIEARSLSNNKTNPNIESLIKDEEPNRNNAENIQSCQEMIEENGTLPSRISNDDPTFSIKQEHNPQKPNKPISKPIPYNTNEKFTPNFLFTPESECMSTSIVSSESDFSKEFIEKQKQKMQEQQKAMWNPNNVNSTDEKDNLMLESDSTSIFNSSKEFIDIIKKDPLLPDHTGNENSTYKVRSLSLVQNEENITDLNIESTSIANSASDVIIPNNPSYTEHEEEEEIIVLENSNPLIFETKKLINQNQTASIKENSIANYLSSSSFDQRNENLKDCKASFNKPNGQYTSEEEDVQAQLIENVEEANKDNKELANTLSTSIMSTSEIDSDHFKQKQVSFIQTNIEKLTPQITNQDEDANTNTPHETEVILHSNDDFRETFINPRNSTSEESLESKFNISDERKSLKVGFFKEKPSKKVFLPYFVQYGTVESVLITNENNMYSITLTFKKHMSAKRAKKKLNGSLINGIRIKIKWNEKDIPQNDINQKST